MSLSRDAVAEIVRRAVGDTLQVDPSAIHDATTSADFNGWDSFAHGMVLLKIEQKLDAPIELEPLYATANVGELIDAVHAMLQRADGKPA